MKKRKADFNLKSSNLKYTEKKTLPQEGQFLPQVQP
jgi:hypothetical protein